MTTAPSRISPTVFIASLVFAIVLTLVIFGGPGIPHWSVIAGYPLIILFGIVVGFRWKGLGAGQYLLIGVVLGGMMYIALLIGEFVTDPGFVSRQGEVAAFFIPFVRLGVAGALAFSGSAIVSDMAARQRFSPGKFVAGLVAFMGAVAGLLTALK